jgi:hypothetical protein
MVAVFNDCNMTISIANAESAFVTYNKVIWYLMCYFQMNDTRDAGCYSFVALMQNTRVTGQITVVKRVGTSCPLAHISNSSSHIPGTGLEILT